MGTQEHEASITEGAQGPPGAADEVIHEEPELRDFDGTRADLSCDTCNAALRWDPVKDALACDYCETTRTVLRDSRTILERPLTADTQGLRGLGIDTRSVRCSECDASVALESSVTATTCAFCGSSAILEQGENRNLIRPESLVPLDVGLDDARLALRKWIRGLWFRPGALKKLDRFEATGIYLPAWTFDARVHSDWTADAGYYYWVTQTYTTQVNGKTVTRTRQVRKVRWVPAWGERDDAYNDVLVLGSHAISTELARELGDFDLSALVPYRAEYLAGWRAEEYQVDLMGSWESGRGVIEDSQQRRCSGDVPGDTQRFLRVQNRITDVHWKHLLVPVWTVSYRFGGKSWPVVVHGQSGNVVGKAPLSWWKILGVSLGVVALIALVFAILVGTGVVVT
tara:strand:- start:7964 stop:9157 length:1194 start_codon:yes stop_codon:yes gene_type:complete